MSEKSTAKSDSVKPEKDVMELITADIGGTNARFAFARVANGRVLEVEKEITLKTAEHASLQLAWEHFGRQVGRTLPDSAAIAIACPIHGEVLKLTNNPWVIRPADLPAKLGVKNLTLVNDFGAVAHAVAHVGEESLKHLCGPNKALPQQGVITIVGPGTGLGVAYLTLYPGGYIVGETEGGHINFSPVDELEDNILRYLRRRFRRVSVERIVSGPGLGNIYETLAANAGLAVARQEDKVLWDMALSESDHLASAAFDRFCMCLGTAAGNYALAQGARGVVIAGGLGQRLADFLPRSGFAERFVDKGRFERMMADIPVKLMTYPQPGLLGAAAAFAKKYTVSGIAVSESRP
ncbi:glucokinase [Entomobacter blattae]|uniref:Glucokinase n=1 Tax=Entomobacter blattae TaxID=2762277 RepID=A0A7H1NQR4_9PROT|nr:glucokinase [Entomobacter blattae]QNT78124.1 Glucokinase [Entomobacter blattae]